MPSASAWGPWTVEVTPSVTFFTDNNDFFNGSTLAQAPIYLVRGSIIYNFESGMWVSLDGTYFTGGRTTVNGVRRPAGVRLAEACARDHGADEHQAHMLHLDACEGIVTPDTSAGMPPDRMRPADALRSDSTAIAPLNVKALTTNPPTIGDVAPGAAAQCRQSTYA